MELSPTARVILGMIRLGRRTGYEMKQLVDVSTRFFWAASYGQIYPELRRLEQAGLVASESQPTGGRARVEYRLTDAGERALDDWLAATDEPLFELRDEGLLKLFFSSEGDPDQVLATLRAVRERHELTLESLCDLREQDGKTVAGPGLTLEFGIEFNEFAIDWCRRAERRVARHARAAA
jgi:PadR family transcriptional regulator AphA